MWPFNRNRTSATPPKPELDPIGVICRMLVERPWEWKPEEDVDDEFTVLVHATGVTVMCRLIYLNKAEVMVGYDTGVTHRLTDGDAWRIYRGVQAHAAALVSRKLVRFTDSALALAEAIKAGGDLAAVYALIDEIMEHNPRPE